MKQQQFDSRGAARWQAFAAQLEALEGFRSIARRAGNAAGSAPDELRSDSFVANYRAVCRDLALAIERGYSTRLVDQLNDLALRGHSVLYVRRSGFLLALREFFVREFPRQVRAQWRYVLVATLCFVLPALLVSAAILAYPDAVHYVMSGDEIREFEEMYAPGQKIIGHARDAGSDFMMFGFYIRHNIGLGFQCFAGGIILGIGPVLSLFYNGLSIGAVAAHLGTHGFGATFFPFVAAHGAFELTAIVLAGAAGLKLGMALLNPGRLRRADALKFAAREAVPIVLGVFLMLIIAAFIEAFWSSRAFVPAWTKYLVAAVLWSLVLIYFTFGGRLARDGATGQNTAEARGVAIRG